MDWIAKYHRRRSIRRLQDRQQIMMWRQTSQSLAQSIQQLCGLCDDLIDVIAQAGVEDDKLHLMETLPARVATVRKYALCIAAEADLQGSGAAIERDDPYSLTELQRILDSIAGG